MRYLIFIAFLLLSFISHATDSRFEEGVEAYQNNNYQQAFAIFLPLAQAGNVDAQLSVGTMYDRGQGVEKDPQEALKWYKIAADQGDNIAKSLLKTMFNSTEGTTEYQDDQKAHGTDNTPDPINSIELISPTLSREETLNQILNQSRLSVLTLPEKNSSSVAATETSFFSSATYHKIEHWIRNSLIYIVEFIGFLVFCFVLFHALKRKKSVNKTPVFYNYAEDELDEEVVEEPLLEEVAENAVHEEILPTVYFESEPIQKPQPLENVDEAAEEDEKALEKETLFEYCYNNNAYDEEKLSENPITKIQRRRYKGSIMEYCYEECYH